MPHASESGNDGPVLHMSKETQSQHNGLVLCMAEDSITICWIYQYSQSDNSSTLSSEGGGSLPTNDGNLENSWILSQNVSEARLNVDAQGASITGILIREQSCHSSAYNPVICWTGWSSAAWQARAPNRRNVNAKFGEDCSILITISKS